MSRFLLNIRDRITEHNSEEKIAMRKVKALM